MVVHGWLAGGDDGGENAFMHLPEPVCPRENKALAANGKRNNRRGSRVARVTLVIKRTPAGPVNQNEVNKSIPWQ